MKLPVIGGIILSAVMMSCASTKVVTAPAQTDVDRVQEQFPGYTLAQLNEGKSLYESHCGNCHALKKPGDESEKEWREEVPKMVQKVNRKENITLGDEKEELILRYVLTMGPLKK
ncbi:MAG: hypothetical protein EP332_10320 [Bacteroidetes bacterium]|nr:MAG: hypothetical protein EP332_10320 [Bacteroidota bacterium]